MSATSKALCFWRAEWLTGTERSHTLHWGRQKIRRSWTRLRLLLKSVMWWKVLWNVSMRMVLSWRLIVTKKNAGHKCQLSSLLWSLSALSKRLDSLLERLRKVPDLLCLVKRLLFNTFWYILSLLSIKLASAWCKAQASFDCVEGPDQFLKVTVLKMVRAGARVMTKDGLLGLIPKRDLRAADYCHCDIRELSVVITELRPETFEKILQRANTAKFFETKQERHCQSTDG